MTILDLIEKKKNHLPLSEAEYKYFIDNFSNGKIPDYQASALLMAIRINGCTDEETYYLTKAMVESSPTYAPKANHKLHLLIDKHSSGGIGDKVTLIISPILASIGFDIAKVSGRGLGFTGGTIDKLESIGAKMEYDPNQFQKFLDKYHFSIMYQNPNTATADKKLYHLRDVTGTIDSLPLIASSILSKKFNFKTDYIFLDLKVGSGAFCPTLEMANELARLMLEIAKRFNRKLVIFLTSMDGPLGTNIGNANEIYECIEFLKGNFHSPQLKDFIYSMLSNILIITKVAKTEDEAIKLIDHAINSEEAFDYFYNYVNGNNGLVQHLNDHSYWEHKYHKDVYATKDGYLSFKYAKELGCICQGLKAGRLKKEDKIDYGAGIVLHHETSDYVKKGEKIATLYANSPIADELVTKFNENISYLKQPVDKAPKIIKIIRA